MTRSLFFQLSPHDQRVLWHMGKGHQPIPALQFRDRPQDEWAGGTIVAVDDSSLALDLGTREVALWPGTGIPVRQLLVDVQTDEAAGKSGPDDGVRRFWIRQENLYTPNGSYRRGTKYGMLIAALAEAGIPEQLPEIGGQLWMRWVGWDDASYQFSERVVRTKGKLWEVRYERPPV